MAAYTAVKYETNDLKVVDGKARTNTVTSWNPSATGTVTLGISANFSGGYRQNGVNARHITATWHNNTAPAGYDPRGRLVIPIFTNTAFDAINKGDQLAYAGGTIAVSSKRSEQLV